MYELSVYYEGFDVALDKEIESLVGQPRIGSGCGFGGRDIQFEFESKIDAGRAADRLEILRGTLNLDFSVDDLEDYDSEEGE